MALEDSVVSRNLEESFRAAYIREFLDRLLVRTGVPGIAVSCFADGVETTVCRGVAQAPCAAELTPDARFQVGCLVQLLTCIATLSLAQSGEISLDAPFTHYLGGSELAPQVRAIRISHLLSHTSGARLDSRFLGEAGTRLTWESFTASLRHLRQSFTPGSVFNYSGLDHVVLAKVLERATGRTLWELLRERVLEAAGLSFGHSQTDRKAGRLFVQHHRWNRDSMAYEPYTRHADLWLFPITDLTMSVRELLALTQVLIEHCHAPGPWNFQGDRHFGQTLVRVPWRAQKLWEYELPVGYGLGCAQFADGFLGHSGRTSGQCCSIRFDMAGKRAIAVALNASTPQIRDGIVRAICRELFGSNAVRAVPAPEPVFVEQELVGEFKGGDGFSDLSVRRGPDRGLVVEIRKPGAGILWERVLMLDDGNRVVESEARKTRNACPLRFFRDPLDDAPCMMFGWHAYKRSMDNFPDGGTCEGRGI